MGYSTRFTGRFELSKLPPVEVIVALNHARDGEFDDDDHPDRYCRWRFTADLRGIEWDHSEKFYLYDEWLQWIVTKLLVPVGVEVTGCVKYQGEDLADRGTLAIGEGKVVQTKSKPVDDADALEFRDFVMTLDDRGDILRAWHRYKNR